MGLPSHFKFDEYLKEMYKGTNSLIVVDNFNGKNIFRHNTPIILRNPVPVIHREPQLWGNFDTLILGASTIVYDNMSMLGGEDFFPYLSSKFLVGFDSRDMTVICLRISLSGFL